MRRGRRPVETQKKLILGQPAHVLIAVASEQEGCQFVTEVCPFTLTPNLISLTGIQC